MNKLKQQISELLNNMPKHMRWLLLGVAFVVVIILLTLLMGQKKTNVELPPETSEDSAVNIKITPDEINWPEVLVGQTKEQKIIVTTNSSVSIKAVSKPEVDGLEVTNTCESAGFINEDLSCDIIVKFAPTIEMDTIDIPIEIEWYAEQATPEMSEISTIPVAIGAYTTEINDEATPVVIPEPEPEPKPEPEPEPEPEPQPVVRVVEDIAAGDPFEKPQRTPANLSEPCSEFAFPGYNLAGNQSGWIKPKGGAYYFHPFSDADCSDDPTGIYNPDSGLIMDINNRGRKIGSDAEHIGYVAISGGRLPEWAQRTEEGTKPVNRARQNETPSNSKGSSIAPTESAAPTSIVKPAKAKDVIYGTTGTAVVSTQPYDRSFVLRQFKPIPATIVSDVRADIEMLQSAGSLPVRATVDRNVYSDNGRTVILPAGTLLMGYVTDEIPGPYKAIGRMEIKWYQFILPNGVEFNFDNSKNDPFSADAQGRVGVPGRGSTDYLEQFVMPMLTAFVPATINLINPVADAFVNQIDLDNNTVVQSGKIRSSELAKNEIITAWNSVAQKLLVDMMDNTVPPFTIPAGTRITVYSPVDLQVACDGNDKCKVSGTDKDKDKDENKVNNKRRDWGTDVDSKGVTAADDDSWIGQARSWMAAGNEQFCEEVDGLWRVKPSCAKGDNGELNPCGGYSYATLKLWCDSLNYQSKKELQYEAYKADQSAQYQQKIEDLGGEGSQQFNEEILGIQYNADGTVKNPYASSSSSGTQEAILTCEDGNPPDQYGCCAGEVYTDMGEDGFNCCPTTGGDCFPPLI